METCRSGGRSAVSPVSCWTRTSYSRAHGGRQIQLERQRGRRWRGGQKSGFLPQNLGHWGCSDSPRSAASSLEKPDTCGILGTKVGRLSTPQFICLSFTPWPLAPLSPPQPCTVPLCGEKHAPKAQALLVFRTLSQEERLILRCSLETSGVLFLSQRSAIGGENCNSKRSHFSLSDFRTFNLSLSLCKV